MLTDNPHISDSIKRNIGLLNLISRESPLKFTIVLKNSLFTVRLYCKFNVNRYRRMPNAIDVSVLGSVQCSSQSSLSLIDTCVSTYKLELLHEMCSLSWYWSINHFGKDAKIYDVPEGFIS